MLIKQLFIVSLVLLSGCTATHWGYYHDGTESYKTVKLAEQLYAFEYANQRSIFVVGQDSIIVTDPLGPKAAAYYKKAIREISGKPINALVYSSSFVNRIGGSDQFNAKRIVSHEQCQTNLEATPFPSIDLPNEVYSERYTLDAGGAGLELYYFGESYGTCLSVMIARPSNIMMIAGLVSPASDGAAIGTVPGDPTLANYYLHNILPFFTEVERLAAVMGVEQIVGSDIVSDAPPLAPVTLIGAQQEFWNVFFSSIEVLYKRRVPANVIPKRADMTVFEKFEDYDKARVQTMMRRGYSLFRIGR